MDISNPESPNYSQWMSISEINEMVSPLPEKKAALRQLLEEHHIAVVADHGDFFRVRARVHVIESVFATQVWDWHHHVYQQKRLTRAKKLTMPSWMTEHVEMVSGLTELPRSTLKPKQYKTSPGSEEIIPQFLRMLYNISQTASVEGQNSTMCVAEFQDDNAYLKSDMASFYKKMAEPSYTIKDVGPFSTSGGPDAESSLDIQFAGAISRGATQWFWVDNTWMLSFSQLLYSTPSAPLVVSMSWGWPENGQCEDGIGSCSDPKDYVSRVNTEFSKIVARGITLVAASGDQGAPGDNFPGCSAGLSDLFPASSPWVLAVGATQLGTNPGNSEVPASSPVTAPICRSPGISCARGDVLTEEVCTYPTSLITTGGGFSSYTTQPSYQSIAVAGYFAQKVPLPPSSMYNKANRAFPDVAALGHNYLIYLQGQATQVDGTSCSSPVFGAMIALLNAQRLKAGKRPLGFSNPLWYKAPAGVFRDITQGNNKCTEGCCSKDGWEAAKGWDPVTGLGSLNYPAALSYVMSLP